MFRTSVRGPGSGRSSRASCQARFISLLGLYAVFLAGFDPAVVRSTVQGSECPPLGRRLSPPVPTLEKAYNPMPMEADIELPMPCGGKLVLRSVCVPAGGYFEDFEFELGCKDCGRPNQTFMDGRRTGSISGSFTLRDLPEVWRLRLTEAAKKGTGRCPNAGEESETGFYYFIGKYEISNFQWEALEGGCPGSGRPLTSDGPRPKTGISWFEAVDFTRRYTEWLLENRPEALPRFPGGRFAYLRLPTEGEWEYAARGGHLVTEGQINGSDFFPLRGRPFSEYGVFTDPESAKPPDRLAQIGSKCSNPLGLFDTAGNASEMVLDPFRFSVGSRLQGATGGFISKGGSYRKTMAEALPGRREELPFFLEDGAYRSTDLGFRIVLSAIVTPGNRKEALDREWASMQKERQDLRQERKRSAPSMTIDRDKDPTTEIDRLVELSEDENERENYRFLKKVILRNGTILDRLRHEAVRGTIRSGLFASESVMNYAIRRNIMVNRIMRLEKTRKGSMSQSVLKSLEAGLADTRETIRKLEAAIDRFTRYYIDSVEKSQMYSDDYFMGHIDRIYRELDEGNGVSEGLKNRLDLFKKHVALQKTREGRISHKLVLMDIIPPHAR